MAKTLLQLVQQACNEMSLTPPTYVLTNPDVQVTQLLALANAEGAECAVVETNQGAWPALRKTYTFTMQNGVGEYALPSDYNFMLASTMWDTTTHWRIIGPVDPSGWNLLQYGVINSAAPFYRFKIEANKISLFPAPNNSTDVVAFTYVSNGWCQSAAGVPQSDWLADTDTYLLDERLMILGLKMRYKQAKGLDYAAELQLYKNRLEWYKGNAGGTKPLSLVGSAAFPLLSWYNLPDAGYGA